MKPFSLSLPMTDPNLLELVKAAQRASLSAYNPYSKFAVGCALWSKTGKVYLGCNIENASYSVTICAERVAASQAILNGDLDWEAMVVVSPHRVTACGVCRQFLHEFAPHLKLWCGYLDNTDIVGPFVLNDLLPAAMSLSKAIPAT